MLFVSNVSTSMVNVAFSGQVWALPSGSASLTPASTVFVTNASYSGSASSVGVSCAYVSDSGILVVSYDWVWMVPLIVFCLWVLIVRMLIKTFVHSLGHSSDNPLT